MLGVELLEPFGDELAMGAAGSSHDPEPIEWLGRDGFDQVAASYTDFAVGEHEVGGQHADAVCEEETPESAAACRCFVRFG
jgi:hypothetical protein